MDCSKQQKYKKQDEFWRGIIQKYEDRNIELEKEQLELQARVDQMEAAMPALMAFNMAKLANEQPDANVDDLVQMPCICKQLKDEPSKPPLQIPDLSSISVFSIEDADVHYMDRIKELSDEEKKLIDDVNKLRSKEKALKETKQNMDGLMDTPDKQFKAPVNSKDLQQMNRQLIEENRRLNDDVADLKLELKHTREKVEGPMSRELDRQRRKVMELESELKLKQDQDNNKDDDIQREINFLKSQVESEAKNLADMIEINNKLKDEIEILNIRAQELQNDLINQKISEANTLALLKAQLKKIPSKSDSYGSVKSGKPGGPGGPGGPSGPGGKPDGPDGPDGPGGPDSDLPPDSSDSSKAGEPKERGHGELYDIARDLSHDLAETKDDDTIPQDLKGTVKEIKELCDLVDQQTHDAIEYSDGIETTPVKGERKSIEHIAEELGNVKSVSSKSPSVNSTNKDSMENLLVNPPASFMGNNDQTIEDDKNATYIIEIPEPAEPEDTGYTEFTLGDTTEEPTDTTDHTMETTEEPAETTGYTMETTEEPTERIEYPPAQPTETESEDNIEFTSTTCVPECEANELPTEETLQITPKEQSTASMQKEPEAGDKTYTISTPKTPRSMSIDKDMEFKPALTSTPHPSSSDKNESDDDDDDVCNCAELTGKNASKIDSAYVERIEVITELECGGPVDIETDVKVIKQCTDGLNVTTTVTRSGVLEVSTEGPGGIIETTMTLTLSGNIEVVTEFTESGEKTEGPKEGSSRFDDEGDTTKKPGDDTDDSSPKKKGPDSDDSKPDLATTKSKDDTGPEDSTEYKQTEEKYDKENVSDINTIISTIPTHDVNKEDAVKYDDFPEKEKSISSKIELLSNISDVKEKPKKEPEKYIFAEVEFVGKEDERKEEPKKYLFAETELPNQKDFPSTKGDIIKSSSVTESVGYKKKDDTVDKDKDTNKIVHEDVLHIDDVDKDKKEERKIDQINDKQETKQLLDDAVKDQKDTVDDDKDKTKHVMDESIKLHDQKDNVDKEETKPVLEDVIKEDVIKEDAIKEDTIKEDTVKEDTIKEDAIKEDASRTDNLVEDEEGEKKHLFDDGIEFDDQKDNAIDEKKETEHLLDDEIEEIDQNDNNVNDIEATKDLLYDDTEFDDEKAKVEDERSSSTISNKECEDDEKSVCPCSDEEQTYAEKDSMDAQKDIDQATMKSSDLIDLASTSSEEDENIEEQEKEEAPGDGLGDMNEEESAESVESDNTNENVSGDQSVSVQSTESKEGTMDRQSEGDSLITHISDEMKSEILSDKTDKEINAYIESIETMVAKIEMGGCTIVKTPVDEQYKYERDSNNTDYELKIDEKTNLIVESIGTIVASVMMEGCSLVEVPKSVTNVQPILDYTESEDSFKSVQDKINVDNVCQCDSVAGSKYDMDQQVPERDAINQCEKFIENIEGSIVEASLTLMDELEKFDKLVEGSEKESLDLEEDLVVEKETSKQISTTSSIKFVDASTEFSDKNIYNENTISQVIENANKSIKEFLEKAEKEMEIKLEEFLKAHNPANQNNIEQPLADSMQEDTPLDAIKEEKDMDHISGDYIDLASNVESIKESSEIGSKHEGYSIEPSEKGEERSEASVKEEVGKHLQNIQLPPSIDNINVREDEIIKSPTNSIRSGKRSHSSIPVSKRSSRLSAKYMAMKEKQISEHVSDQKVVVSPKDTESLKSSERHETKSKDSNLEKPETFSDKHKEIKQEQISPEKDTIDKMIEIAEKLESVVEDNKKQPDESKIAEIPPSKYIDEVTKKNEGVVKSPKKEDSDNMIEFEPDQTKEEIFDKAKEAKSSDEESDNLIDFASSESEEEKKTETYEFPVKRKAEPTEEAGLFNEETPAAAFVDRTDYVVDVGESDMELDEKEDITLTLSTETGQSKESIDKTKRSDMSDSIERKSQEKDTIELISEQGDYEPTHEDVDYLINDLVNDIHEESDKDVGVGSKPDTADTDADEVCELKKLVTQIKCACKEAENLKGPGFIKRAADFKTTLSALQISLDLFQEKCKTKDVLIDSMKNKLKLHARSKIFDDLLGRFATPKENIPDYNRNVLAESLAKPRKEITKFGQRPISCECSEEEIIQEETEEECFCNVNPEPLRITDIDRIGPTSILIRWDPSASEKIIGYELYVNKVTRAKIFSRTRTTAILDLLDFKENINIDIYALCHNGKCLPASTGILEVSGII